MKIKSVKNLNELMMKHGQETSMSAKRAVWKAKGLDKRWGIYNGTPAQMHALVNALKDNPTVPSWITNISKAFSSSKNLAPLPVATAANPNMSMLPTENQSVVPVQTKQDVVNLPEVTPPPAPQYSPVTGIGTAKGAYTFAGKGNWQPTAVNKPSVANTDQAVKMMAGGIDTINKTSTETSSTSSGKTPIEAKTLKDLGIETPGEEDVMNQVLNSPEFKLTQERLGLRTLTAEGVAEAGKAALETKFGANKAQLENNLAAKGLAFSGIRTSQVQGLIDELATSKLGVDRTLAQTLLDANMDLKEAVMDAASKVITDAKAGRAEAIGQLNKLGMAVVGDQLIPIPTKTTTGTKMNTLTLAEAKSLGIPLSLVGMSQDEILGQFNDPNPPAWFRKLKEQELQQSLLPTKLQSLWDEYRRGVQSGKKTTTKKTTTTKVSPEIQETGTSVNNLSFEDIPI